MHVGLVINDLRVGGAEVLLCELVRVSAAVAREVRFTIFVLRAGGALEARARALGVDVVALRARGGLAPGRLAEECRRRGVDLLHAHLSRAAWVARLAARIARIPSITTEHTDWRYSPWPARIVNRVTARLDHQLVAVSHAVRAGIVGRCPSLAGRMTVIHNGIDTAVVRRAAADREGARRGLGLPRDGALLLAVGNLHPIKRPGDAVEALARVRATGRAAALVIVGGDRGARPRLEQEIAARGLGGVVLLAGVVADVPALLAAADVFVLTSAFEGLPLSLLEACAAGVPVVATAVGGVREVLEDGVHGRLVPAGAPARLAAAILAALDDPATSRRLAEAARRRVAHDFAIEDCASGYTAVYRATLNRGWQTSPSPTR